MTVPPALKSLLTLVALNTWLDICPYDGAKDKKKKMAYGSYHMEASSSGEPLDVCDPHGHCVTLSHDKYCADTASAKKRNGDRFDVEKVDHDGLVGLACTTGKYAKHLGCSAFAEAKETFVYDRKADGSGQVCFSNPRGGDECQPLRRHHGTTRVKLDTSTPVPVANGMILDTGSSATSQLPGKTREIFGATCLVGFPDIKHLELNYDQNYIEYIVDEEAVTARCPALKQSKDSKKSSD